VGSEVQILPGPPSGWAGPVGRGLVSPGFDGGVAQLGEHLLCKQGVVGSIPITSIFAWSRFATQTRRGCEGKNPERSGGWPRDRCRAGWSRLIAEKTTVRSLIGAVAAYGWWRSGMVSLASVPYRVRMFLIFVRVNQVLVRFWARCSPCLTGGDPRAAECRSET
jgi:hypothetical protein